MQSSQLWFDVAEKAKLWVVFHLFVLIKEKNKRSPFQNVTCWNKIEEMLIALFSSWENIVFIHFANNIKFIFAGGFLS